MENKYQDDRFKPNYVNNYIKCELSKYVHCRKG